MDTISNLSIINLLSINLYLNIMDDHSIAIEKLFDIIILYSIEYKIFRYNEYAILRLSDWVDELDSVLSELELDYVKEYKMVKGNWWYYLKIRKQY